MSAHNLMETLHSASTASVFGFEAVTAARFETVFARLLVAFVLGAIVSYRPWRALIPSRRRPLPPTVENAQAQTLIAVAGALMVSVIGDNMARAFGLVGLGAFIRFRSGIKDPRDAAVMFVMIGIGMACGLGAIPMALVAAVRLAIEMDQPRAALPALQSAVPGARVLEIPNAGVEPGRVVLEASIRDSADAASLLDLFEERQVPGIRRVTIEEGRPNGG